VSNKSSHLKALGMLFAYIGFAFFVAIMAAKHYGEPLGNVAWVILFLLFAFIMAGNYPELNLQRHLSTPQARFFTVVGMGVIATALALAGFA
jgi:energy-coupling factor transporter transmembrane protein EcfT